MSNNIRKSKLSATPSTAHNSYIDLKNKWAESAFDTKYSLLDILCFFLVVFMLGWLSSCLIMFSLKSSQSYQLEISLADPQYVTIIESTSDYIDFAASKNGAEIVYELSAPEFHGSFARFIGNNLEALISDQNSPEQCWPSLKNESFATIKLASPIFPIGFSIVLPPFFTKTMPKKVNVYSLDGDKSFFLQEIRVNVDKNSEKMPKTVFAECGFNCQEPIRMVRIEVTENYGDEFNCVYQFKVHGLKTAK